MIKLPLVRDHMDTHVHTLGPDIEILAAVRFLLDHQVTGAPVVDKDSRLLGAFTEKDCMKLVAAGIEGNLPSGTVGEYMITDVRTIPPDMDIYYVAGLFLHETFRRFPVVENGKLVGAITRFDILRAIEANLRNRDQN